MRDLTIQQYRNDGYHNGDERKIIELFQKAFGREMMYEVWAWRFMQNPCRKLYITTLWDGERLIAHTALTPSWAYRKGKRIVAAVGGTTMSDPDYLGVLIQTAQYDAMQYGDIDFRYGFPNKNSYRIFTKYLGRRVIGSVCFWKKNVEGKLYNNHNIREISCFEPDHAELFKCFISETEYITERSFEYLNWRFIAKPDSGYSCFELIQNGTKSGYIVLNIYVEEAQRQCQIIDIVAESEGAYSSLLMYADNYAFMQNCEIIKLWATYDKLASVLRNRGYLYGDRPFVMITDNELLDIEKMYITMADSDVF